MKKKLLKSYVCAALKAAPTLTINSRSRRECCNDRSTHRVSI